MDNSLIENGEAKFVEKNHNYEDINRVLALN